MQDEIRIERIPLRVIALNYFVMSVIVLFVLFVTATSALDCLLIKLKMIKFCCEKSHILFTRKLSTKNLSTLFSCFPSSRIPSKLFERVAFRFPSPQRSGTEFFRTEGQSPFFFLGDKILELRPIPQTVCRFCVRSVVQVAAINVHHIFPANLLISPPTAVYLNCASRLVWERCTRRVTWRKWSECITINVSGLGEHDFKRRS